MHYIYSRRFYPKRLTIAFRLYIFFLWVHLFPGNRTHNLCAANAMLYHWATGALLACVFMVLIRWLGAHLQQMIHLWLIDVIFPSKRSCSGDQSWPPGREAKSTLQNMQQCIHSKTNTSKDRIGSCKAMGLFGGPLLLQLWFVISKGPFSLTAVKSMEVAVGF